MKTHFWRLSRWFAWMLMLILTCFIQTTSARAEKPLKIFAIHSATQMRQLVLAAHFLAKDFPDLEFSFRTTEQASTLSAERLQKELQEADVIFIGMIYAELAEKLKAALHELDPNHKKTILVMTSEISLHPFSTFHSQRPFESMDIPQIRKIMDTPSEESSPFKVVDELEKQHPSLKNWFQAWRYVLAKGPENYKKLFLYLLSFQDKRFVPQAPDPMPNAFIYRDGMTWTDFTVFSRFLDPSKKTVGILDYDSYFLPGNVELMENLADQLERRGLNVIPVYAGWGKPSADALKIFFHSQSRPNIDILISLQSFIIGGSQARDEASAVIEKMNVPVLRAIRVDDRNREEWKESPDGIPWDDVYYQVALPELQGISEPTAVACETPLKVDPLTGAQISTYEPILERINHLASRVWRWTELKRKVNAEKKIAIIYYNHPPGRQNIGADNLSVPESLFEILKMLRESGYETGELPDSSDTLLKLMIRQGANVAKWAPGRLRDTAPHMIAVPAVSYEEWFRKLSPQAVHEVVYGPVAALYAVAESARDSENPDFAVQRIKRTLEETLAYVEHDTTGAAKKVSDLLKKTEDFLMQVVKGEKNLKKWKDFMSRLSSVGIEGLKGWGPPPGQVMALEDFQGQPTILIPGLIFGNVFIGAQPHRGWDGDPDVLHSSLAVPPHHQYLGFYYYLQETFKADALIHLGRHSTYEWLPRKQVTLSEEDFPDIVLGDLPSIYPYIVDGVGEGLQAKRRGLAVIIDHLTPPLKTTTLYENLLQLRQFVEQYESQAAVERKAVVIEEIFRLLEELNLMDEIEEKIRAEHGLKGNLRSIREDLLVHEIGHYLTELQEKFMPYGLHTFGRAWPEEQKNMMVESMLSADKKLPIEKREMRRKMLSNLLDQSFESERSSLLHALSGEYVRPGKGNDPIRTPEALPTGRNFYALDASLMPTKVSYVLGKKLAEKSFPKDQKVPEKISTVLWAVGTVRDEGTMVGFILAMLGLEPEWDARGIVKGFKVIPVKDLGRSRVDVLVTTSGLFRDIFSQLLILLDDAFRLTLAQSRQTILKKYPQLKESLETTLKPVAEKIKSEGNETFQQNPLAKHWVKDALSFLKQGKSRAESGSLGALRIFSVSPGDYSAGVNRTVEQPWMWKDRQEVAKIYVKRMMHGYSRDFWGVAQPEMFNRALHGVKHSYHNKTSNLYGLVDNNDYFDYFGGLSMAVEAVNGKVPENLILSYANPNEPKIEPLQQAVASEMRVRYFNPEWIKGMMKEGYAGARTISNEFIEYFWGWQVTNPDIVRDWMWSEITNVYVRDKYKMGLKKWFREGDRAYAKMNAEAVLLTAVHKGFWKASEEERKEIAKDLQELVIEFGPASSSHTCGDTPMLKWAEQYMDSSKLDAFQKAMKAVISDQAKGSEGAQETYQIKSYSGLMEKKVA